MADAGQRLGSDLALTAYTGLPGAAPLHRADSWGSLDLRVDASGRGTTRDLGAVSGRDTLGQALILRLLTPLGSLAALGHAGYGCRLVELIGQRNTETARNLARLYTLEALRQEPRLREVLDLAVTPVPGQPNTLRIDFSVLPIGDGEALSLGLEIAL